VQRATLLLGYIFAGADRGTEARELGADVLRTTVATGCRSVATDAVDLLAIADVAIGEPEQAILFAGLAERLRADSNEPRQSSGERLYRPAIEAAERLLGSERFGEALARGAGLTLEEAVALAAMPHSTGVP